MKIGVSPPVASGRAGLASSLRAATRTAHASVDGAFPQGLDSLQAYVRYLTAILPLARWLHASWQPQWRGWGEWHDTQRLHCLHADLARLDAVPEADGPGARPAGSPPEWLGGCYVMEGSAIGARLLARDLDRLAPDFPRVVHARSFIDHLIAHPPRWARFRDALDALPDSAAAAALHGARRGFALVSTRLAATEAIA